MSINVNFAQVKEYMDINKEIANALDSENHKSRLSRAIAVVTAAAFDAVADQTAQENPTSLHHVYEWGRLGEPQGRLFRLIISGQGRTKNMDYKFMASRKPVPREEGPGDTRGLFHIFYWKAPIWEAGDQVFQVSPLYARALAWWSPNANKMMFSRGTVSVSTRTPAAGQFANLWNMYWTSMADEIVKMEIAEPTEQKLQREIPKIYNNISKPGPGVGINVRGQKNHTRAVTELSRSVDSGYTRAAEQRRRFAGRSSLEAEGDI